MAAAMETVVLKSKEARSAYETYAQQRFGGSLEAASCQIFTVLREHHQTGRIGGNRAPPNPEQSHSLFTKWLNNNLQHLRRDWWNCIEDVLGVQHDALVASHSATDPMDEPSEELSPSTSYGVSADKDIANVDVMRTPRHRNVVLQDETEVQSVELAARLSFGAKIYEFEDIERNRIHSGIVAIYQCRIDLDLESAACLQGTAFAENRAERIDSVRIRNSQLDLNSAASASWLVENLVLGKYLDDTLRIPRLVVVEGKFSKTDNIKLTVDPASVRVPILLDTEPDGEMERSELERVKAGIKRQLLQRSMQTFLEAEFYDPWLLCEKSVVIDDKD